MGDDSEWMKLPVNQKCEHKVTQATVYCANSELLTYSLASSTVINY